MIHQIYFCKPEHTYLNNLVPAKTEFYKAGQQRDFADIFNEYFALDDIIGMNRSQDTKKKRNKPNFPDDYSARLVFDTKQGEVSKDFNVAFRTNFNADKILKRPSMVHLTDKESGSTIYVLRNALKHNTSYMRALFGSDMDPEAFNKNELSYDSEKMQPIPEPLLVKALDDMFKDPEFSKIEGFTRIIPEFKVLDDSSFPDQMSYIRPFYGEQLINSSLNEQNSEGLVNYLSTLWGLGLIEKRDRQAEHYVVAQDRAKPSIINFDPDAIVWLQGKQETIKQLEETADMETEMSNTHNISREKIENIVARAEQKSQRMKEVYGLPYSFMYNCIRIMDELGSK